MRPDYNVITDPDDLAREVKYFEGYDAFAFDIEAQGQFRGDPVRCEVTWISLSTAGRAIVIPMGHPIGSVQTGTQKVPKLCTDGKTRHYTHPIWEAPPAQLAPADVFAALQPLLLSDRTKICHSGQTDIVAVTKYLPTMPPPPYFDTIVAQWLTDENSLKGLKDITARYFGLTYDKHNVGACVESHPFDRVARYSYLDAYFDWVHYRRLSRQLSGRLGEVFALEMDLLHVLCQMRLAGQHVDAKRLAQLGYEMDTKLATLRTDIYAAAGRTFNLNSRPQLQHILYAPAEDGGQGLRPAGKTKGGAPSTSAESLAVHKGNRVCDLIVKHAELVKLRGTYIESMLGTAEEPGHVHDGKVHSFFCQYGTVTGRFSGKSPNLQNIPRPGSGEYGEGLRGAFDAAPGWKLIVGDFGQIELVILAHYCGKGRLYEGFHAGHDPHAITASVLFDVPLDNVTKEMRQVSKGCNFCVVYGGGEDTLASMAKVSHRKAKAFLADHERLFPEIYDLRRRVFNAMRSRATDHQQPYLETLIGRRRRVPDLVCAQRRRREAAERQAFNSLIQGGAADINKIALVEAHRLLHTHPSGAHLTMTVHDELVATAPAQHADEVKALLTQAMLGPATQDLLRVPLSTDVKICDRWSEAK